MSFKHKCHNKDSINYKCIYSGLNYYKEKIINSENG